MRSRLHSRLVPLTVGVALALALPTAAQIAPSLPSPEQFFGFPMGADRRLTHWDDMVAYYERLAAGSDRMLVETLGLTTLGHPYLLVTLASPDTIRDLPRYQAMQRDLADPRRTSADAAERIAREGKAVVLLGANVHATEIGTSQVMNDVIYRLATETSPWVEHVLDNTIVLVIPSQNPDGQRMVVEWYRGNVGTPYETSPLPELYHAYAGHDNNRDSYALTQVETRHLSRVLYQDWLPEVYLDAHQMGNRSARIFVPPFRNPANPNVDPLVWSQVNLLGQAMAARLHEADKPGVIWGELYNAYWQGANNTTPWSHNMVALLTEVASVNLASPVQQDVAIPGRRRPPGWRRVTAGRPTLPAPTDVQARMNYPRPWLGGAWHLTDIVEYGRLATEGLLESVANRRETLKRNFFRMNGRTIERFTNGDPYAFVIPADQRDPFAVAHLVDVLQAQAAEVTEATAPFDADGRRYPAGTFVVRLDQPFGRWVKDVLEPQAYPEVRWPQPGAPVALPYDVTAWSLGMLMGVQTTLVSRPFEAALRPLPPTAAEARLAPGGVTGSLPVGRDEAYLLSSRPNRSATAVNRLLAAGARVGWTRPDPSGVTGATPPPGDLLVRGVERETVATVARDLGLTFTAAPSEIARLEFGLPAVALYEPWGGNIDAGWTRWVLDQHEFAYTRLRPDDLRDRDALADYDVLLLPQMSSADLIRGQQGRNIRPEYRGGVGADGVREIRRFVTEGGTLIALGNSASFAIEHLSVPLRNVVAGETRRSFYAPGTILRTVVDPTHPIASGLPAELDVMFVENGGYLPSRQATTLPRQIVRYPAGPLRRSGWIVGEERLRGAGAVVESSLGRGRVIVLGFRAQHRGQTWGTFKLLFNSIFYGGTGPETGPPLPTLEVGAAP